MRATRRTSLDVQLELYARLRVHRGLHVTPLEQQLHTLQAKLRECTSCPKMIRPIVHGRPVVSRVFLIGQAPGGKEGVLGKPFAWTAGKTLFKWFAQLGVDEETFRERVYISAVARCFPGKNPKGGDRKPDPTEVEHCSRWMRGEVTLLRPKLLLPVGTMAIERVLGRAVQLKEVVGSVQRVRFFDHETDAIALPHPSGASTWHTTEPGKTLLKAALARVAEHPAFQETFTASFSSAR